MKAETVSQIIAMRSAGYIYSSIANTCGVSESSIKRVCKKHGVTKGDMQHALAKVVQERMIEQVTQSEHLNVLAASLINDTVSLVEEQRALLQQTSKLLVPTNHKEAAVTMRALAQHATALKQGNDAIRSALAILPPEAIQEELPDFVIRFMDEQAVAEERKRQEEAAKEIESGRDAGALH